MVTNPNLFDNQKPSTSTSGIGKRSKTMTLGRNQKSPFKKNDEKRKSIWERVFQSKEKTSEGKNKFAK